MPEPISMTVLLLFKALGGKVLLAKMGLIVKGLMASAHGQSILVLAKTALMAVKTYGFAQGALMVAQMLVILGTVAAGTVAALHARESWSRAGNGDFTGAVKHGTKALREAGPIWTVWSPAT